jgi:GntR family transcriptional regulator, transcriptional repressor for pyruvate dehydrogenase complex
MIEPLKPIRLSERVCEALKKLIDEENFKPGDKFYSENILTTKLQISRSSVREAVRILEATGWVKVEHGKGIYIVNKKHQPFEVFTSWLKNNRTDILEHFEVRLMIDPRAAAYAAQKATAEDIDILDALCEEFSLHADQAPTEVLIKIDQRFHAAIAKSTKNKTLTVLMNTMARNLSEGWISSLHVPDRIQKTVKEHRKIVGSIKKREPEAAERYMVEHLTNALKEIKQLIQKGRNLG